MEQILDAVADQAAIERDFHDVKQVHGAGQQQVRHIFANVAVFNMNLWLHSLIELWAWKQPAKKLRDRSARPPGRKIGDPSHADREVTTTSCLPQKIELIRRFPMLYHLWKRISLRSHSILT